MKLIISSHSRSFLLAAGLWILSVLIYSFTYWGLWSSRPDAFILNKEFNLTPIQDLHAKLWAEDGPGTWPMGNAAKAPVAAELDSLMGSVAELDRTAIAAEKALAPLKQQQSELESESKRALLQHSELMWKNVEHYKSQAWATERDDVKRNEDLVAGLEQQFGMVPPSHQAIVLAEARVVLAHAKYREAVKMAEVSEYVLKNLGKFADPTATAETKRVEEQLRSNTEQQDELRKKLSTVRKHAHDSLNTWYVARQGRLLWLDFLYFSVGVSTTTTFGDIIPNSRIARMFALSQLVISVFLVGYLVSLVGRAGQKNAN